MTLFVFDMAVYVMRFTARVVGGTGSPAAVARDMVAQLLNMFLLYFFMALLNRRSRRSQSIRAAKQVGQILGRANSPLWQLELFLPSIAMRWPCTSPVWVVSDPQPGLAWCRRRCSWRC